MTDQELAEYLMTLPAKDRAKALMLFCYQVTIATTQEMGVVLVKHSQN